MIRASRLLFLSLSLALVGCGEGRESGLVEVSSDEGRSLSPASSPNIYDGTSGAEGANPHFFFLPPVAPSMPSYSGTADDGLEPVVTVCPLAAWDAAEEACVAGEDVAVFSMDAPHPRDRIVVEPGSSYHALWRTRHHPVTAGETYRIGVSVVDRSLGYVDVVAYGRKGFSGFHNTAPGVIAISDQGTLNIAFRIEDGALEAEYCDAAEVEDCDVAFFTYEESGCLQVFENFDESEEALGSRVCVPANAARLDGAPVEGAYAVILTLEEAGVYQGGAVPQGQQVPYFPDLSTDPADIVFDPSSDGVQVVICQVDDGQDAVPETLHPFLRPFIHFADGNTVLPEQYTYGAPECETLGSGSQTAAPAAPGSAPGRGGGFLAHLGRGLSKMASLVLPQPLVARRLHGGLNTTVYSTRGDDSTGEDGGEAVSRLAFVEDDPVAEFGAVLDVDPSNSTATVPATGERGVTIGMEILALDVLGRPFPFQVPVTVSVTTGTDVIQGTVTWEGGGEYLATFTPNTGGTHLITILIDGAPIAGSPFATEVAPTLVAPTGVSTGEPEGR
mgnify:CR=1 FL=1